MKIERLISVFEKKSEELIKEINVDFIGIENLKKIFNVRSDDLNMYYPYDISQKEANALKFYLDNFDFDFKEYSYQLDCFHVD